MTNHVPSERRLVENEAVFRKRNERITNGLQEVADLAAMEGHVGLTPDKSLTFSIFCECSDENCDMRCEISIGEYERIHAERDRFTVLPGHQELRVETVVEETENYFVVRKNELPTEDPGGLMPTDANNV